jgi:hypothetical protein
MLLSRGIGIVVVIGNGEVLRLLVGSRFLSHLSAFGILEVSHVTERNFTDCLHELDHIRLGRKVFIQSFIETLNGVIGTVVNDRVFLTSTKEMVVIPCLKDRENEDIRETAIFVSFEGKEIKQNGKAK